MDDEARDRLIADAKLQNAHEEIRQARANLPIGFGLMAFGAGLAVASAVLPLGIVGTVMIGGLGFLLIPGGLAVLVRSAAGIARANRQLRELAPPTARLLSDQRGS